MKQTAKVNQIKISVNKYAKQEEELQQYREIAKKPASLKAVLMIAMKANFNHSKINIASINVNPIKRLILPALSVKKFAQEGKKCPSTVMKPALMTANQVNL